MIDTQKLRETAGNLKPPHLDIAMLLVGAADQYDAQAAETDLLRKTLDDTSAGIPSRDAEIAVLREALGLALEYWADRQQRYKNRSPVWVQKARAALSQGEQG